MFGRIAAGLVHDLSHPIQNIGNSCRLIMKMHDDLEYRDTFRRTVDREFGIVRRVLDDLKHLGRPVTLERFPLDLARAVRDVVEAMQPLADAAGVTLTLDAPDDATCIVDGDVFALGRVWRNLIMNALQATAPGGSVVAEIVTLADSHARQVHVRIRDTGCGIPPGRLPQIFDDFVTTKRRGLGLGLAISKKIVEQLGGTITVSSLVGTGTTFDVSLSPSTGRPLATSLEQQR
jgi:signal transduction histidine kinase